MAGKRKYRIMLETELTEMELTELKRVARYGAGLQLIPAMPGKPRHGNHNVYLIPPVFLVRETNAK